MMRCVGTLLLALLPVTPGWSATLEQHIDAAGISVDFSMHHSRAGQAAEPFRDGDDVTVRFRLTGSDTGSPLRGAYPAAWLDRVGDGQSQALDPSRCHARIGRLLGGDLFSRAETDLNTYQVLTLNDEASISVVDPLFGYGGSKLLARVALPSPGSDWLLSRDEDRLYVASPQANAVSIIDTRTWELDDTLTLPVAPRQLLLQADGNRLWVEHDGGVVAIDTDSRKLSHRIPLASGIHQMSSDGDSGFLYVTDPAANQLLVVNLDTLRVAARIATGAGPRSPTYSALADAVYIADDDGLLVIDAATLTTMVRIPTTPGVREVRFTPDGRYAFALDTHAGELFIIDAAHHRVIKNGPIPGHPLAVEFSDEIAYLLTAEDSNVWMVSLAGLSDDGTPLSIVDFPAGRYPLSAGSGLSPWAEAVVQAPGHNAVLLANPADQTIYYYKEGMAAAMGSFQNYGRQPRAVLMVDRSLREVEPGVYQTTIKLGAPGSYNVPFFIDAPRTLHCFQARVELARHDAEQPASVPLLLAVRSTLSTTTGVPVELHYRVDSTDHNASAATGLTDLVALVTYRSGLAQRRIVLSEVGAGHYVFEFTPPEPGNYRVRLKSATVGLGFRQSQLVTIVARPTSPSAQHRQTATR